MRRRRTLRGRSEYAQRFRLDPRPEHWMEAGTRHNVGVHAKNGVYEFLEVDQFDQVETRIVGIKKRSTSLSGRACWRAKDPKR